MEFRQEMAKKQYSEQTGSKSSDAYREAELEREVAQLKSLTGREQALDDENIHLQKVVIDLETFVEELRDDKVRLNREVESLKAKLAEDAPTMPVIPKAVAIAIFREGMAYGAGNVCDELDNATDIEINETGHTGGFEVNFTKYFDLSDELDLDYLRSKAVDNSDEEWVVDCLKTLCADNKFECRIHGVDDQQTKDND